MLIANPIYEAASKYLLEGEGDLSDPQVKKMVERLARAAIDPRVRREMDAVEEVDRTINRLLNEERQKYQAALQEKETALQEKETALQEIETMIQAKEQLIADLKKQLEEKENTKTL